MRKYKYSLFVLQSIACLVFLMSCSSTAKDSRDTNDELALWRELSEMKPEALDYISMLLGGDHPVKIPWRHKIKLLRIDRNLPLWKRYMELSWNATQGANYPTSDLRFPPSYVHVFSDNSGFSVYSGLSGSASGTNYFIVLYWNKNGEYWYSTHALPKWYYFDGGAVVDGENIKVSIQSDDDELAASELTVPIQKEKSPNRGPQPKPSSEDSEPFPDSEEDEPIRVIENFEAGE